MKSNAGEGKVFQIYDKQTKTWFDVTPEQYIEFDQWRTHIRNREQYHNRCFSPRRKWCLCDGMCDDCEYYSPNDILSLTTFIIDEEGEKTALQEILEDTSPSIEDVICDKAELDELYELLNKLMPEALEIGRLRQRGLSDEAIARVIGIRSATFQSKIEDVKAQLAIEYPDCF